MISVNNLVKKFGSQLVLDNITEHVSPGEKVVVIGPSGSGKSTFLRCLNLLEMPTSGEIIFDGQNITDKKTDIKFIRSITIGKDRLVIDDHILSPRSIKLECADSFSLRHVASGKFFSLTDIGNHSRTHYAETKEIRIQRIFYFTDERLEEKVDYLAGEL